jgi:hypothetical protein
VASVQNRWLQDQSPDAHKQAENDSPLSLLLKKNSTEQSDSGAARETIASVVLARRFQDSQQDDCVTKTKNSTYNILSF